MVVPYTDLYVKDEHKRRINTQSLRWTAVHSQTLLVSCVIHMYGHVLQYPSQVVASLTFCTVPSTISALRESGRLVTNWDSMGSCWLNTER